MSANNITVIIINPFTKSITQTAIENSYEGLRGAVFPAERGYLEHVHLGAGHGIWIDEEGLFKNWDEQGFFKLGSDLTIAGIGVITQSLDSGDSASCLIPMSEVARVVKWIEPQDVRVAAPYMITTENGVEKKELLSGVETWDYNNQPN